MNGERSGRLWVGRAIPDPSTPAEVIDRVLLEYEDGYLTGITPGTEAPAGVRAFPTAIAIPGLVNAHTHLELAGFDQVLRPGPFPDWLGSLVAATAGLDDADRGVLARHGALECAAAGMTTLVDCAWSGAARTAMDEAGLAGAVLYEVFAPDLSPRTVSARREELASWTAADLAFGWSPHAPYTCDMESIAEVAASGRVWAIHVAESSAEQELFSNRTGPFAGARRLSALALSDGIRRPFDTVASVLDERAIVVHGVHLAPGELGALAAAGSTLVLCPRSNRRLACGGPPLAAARSAGVACAIGTDSPASAGAFDLLAELRALRAEMVAVGEAVDEGWLLGLAGAAGATALGFPDRGVIASGFRADLSILDMPSGVRPATWLLEAATRANVVATMVRGKLVWDHGDQGMRSARQSAARAAAQITGRLRRSVAAPASGV